MLETAVNGRFHVSEETLPAPCREHAHTLSKAIGRSEPHLLLLCLHQSNMAGAQALFAAVHTQRSDLPVIVAIEPAAPETVSDLFMFGAADVVTPPYRTIDVLPRLWRLRQHSAGRDVDVERLKETMGLAQFVGESPALLEVIKRLPAVARCDASVLLTGETGTGKEICARAIHYLSRRSEQPFIPVNCGAIPFELVENELFGHVPGAFTGATMSTTGLVREAHGGTLFLDEIDCLPPPAQVKLLRLLQEKEFRPLGSNRMCQADIRIVAASNANLEEARRAGRLRHDLFYRLNVIALSLPPLRQRREDIPRLARHFQTKYAASFNKPAKTFTPSAMQKLVLYSWPGNVRELENLIERAVALSENSTIGCADIHLGTSSAPDEIESFRAAKAKLVADFEKNYIEQLLLAKQGNITQAAKAANKNRRAFWQLMRKHQIALPARASLG